MTAYLLTGSAAVFSDAAESVVHVIAVAFALFSLWLSTRPAVPKFQYGDERITFFSAGFEGAMIVLAAGSILYTTIQKSRHGLVLENLGNGAFLIVAAGILNAGLGWYLVRIGKRNNSMILEADGKHVLIEVHLLFPQKMELGDAHRLATLVEERLSLDLGAPAEVTAHLESLEDHAEVHRLQHYIGRPE